MKILLASYGAAHVRMIIPLLPLLEKAGYEVLPLALTTAVSAYERLGLAHHRITDYVNPNDLDVMRWAEPLMKRHHNPHAGISKAESIAYLGASMLDLVNAVGEQEALHRYAARGLFAFEPVALGQRIIRQSEADAVIATCSPRLESGLLRAAVGLGRPSFCIVALSPLIAMSYLKRADNAHYIFVGNERFKKQLIDAGRPTESIRITGNPAFDLLCPSDLTQRRARLRAKRKLNESDIVILWAEQPEPANPEWPRQVRQTVVELARLSPHFVPMIRLHPSSQIGAKEVMPEGVQISPPDEDATDALITCDILVTATSTMGYEAALMDKPVIVVRGSQYDEFADYCERDGILVIDRYSDIPGAVQTLTESGPASSKLRAYRHALPHPGHFSGLNVSIINELLSGWPRHSVKDSC